MLTRLTLENFKCFETLGLDLRPLTVLIGPNGTGKSSVAQALMLLRQSAQQGGQSSPIFHTGQPYSEFADLVGFEETVFNQDTSRSIGIGFAAQTELPPTFSPNPSKGDRRLFSTYDVAFALRNGFAQVVHNRGEIQSADGWSLVSDWHAGFGIAPVKVPIGPSTVTIQPQGNIGYPFLLGQVERNEGAPENAHALAQGMAQYLYATFERVINSWRFVPSLRGFAHPDYPLTTRKVEEIHPVQEYNALSADIASTLGYAEHLEDKVSCWIEKITEVPIEHDLNEARGMNQGPRIGVRARSPIAGRNVSIVLEGFGTNQLVFLMFQLAQVPEGGLVTVEEPETHLHPLATARLGNVLAEIVAQEQKQLLITTHSEHLLLSLLNNVAEGKLAAEDLAIYYLNRTDRTVSVVRLAVTPNGMVNGGLPGFFDASLAAQRRHLDALSNRR